MYHHDDLDDDVDDHRLDVDHDELDVLDDELDDDHHEQHVDHRRLRPAGRGPARQPRVAPGVAAACA